MKVKISSEKLQEIIKEELNYVLLEENVELEESFKSKLAGIGAGLAMMGGMGAAQAAPKAPQNKPVATAKAETSINKDGVIGLIHDYMSDRSVDMETRAARAEAGMEAIQSIKDGKPDKLAKTAIEHFNKSSEKEKTYYEEVGKKVKVDTFSYGKTGK